MFSSAMTQVKEFISGAELMKMDFPPLTMLTRFLPSSGLVLLSGLPGAGKTEFLMHQAVQIIPREKVLFYCNEGGPRNFQLRLKSYCRDNKSLSNLIYERLRWPNLSEDDGISMLANTIIKFQPKVIFFDPGPDVFNEENDAAKLKEPLRKIYDLINTLDVCIVFSWHPAKDQFVSSVYGFRGSTAIAGKLDLMYDLTFQRGKRSLILHKLRLECPALFQGQKWAVDLIPNGEERDLRFSDIQTLKDEQEEEKKERLLNVLSQFETGKEYSSTQIVETILKSFKGKMGETTARKCLDRLVEESQFLLVSRNSGKKAAIYKRLDIDN